MKKNINKKNSLYLAIYTISLLSALPFSASAQWSVVDAQAFRQQGKIRGQLASTDRNFQKATKGINQSIVDSGKANQTTLGAIIKQNDENQADTDARFRRALGDHKIINEDVEAMPTITKCAEVTRSRAFGPGGGSFAPVGPGARPGSNGSLRTPTAPGPAGAVEDLGKKMEDKKNNTVTKAAGVKEILEGKKAIKTCLKSMPINDCNGQEGDFAGGDLNTLSLFYNVNIKDAVKPTRSSNGDPVLKAANVTLDDAGLAVFNKNVSNIVGIVPEKLSKEQAQQAGPYQAMWEMLTNRISVITTAFAIKSKEIAAKASGDMAKVYWNTNKEKYNVYFPDYKMPEKNPSELEFLNFLARDTLDKSLDKGVGDDIIALGARSSALANVLALKSMEKQDVMITLLATTLANQLTPIDRTIMEQEKQRYASDKGGK